ncbi:hypothetical protein [Pseudooceanicola sp. 200-1SW]|uniref:hypothetical protein n=1 Tax=Pseudooceanicola sp. 200-1SW TaxID=3425949 RepID=UPI003D7FD24D
MPADAAKTHPVVLRFQSMFPHQLDRYVLHEDRKGRGSKHCDPDMRNANRLNLIGDDTWRTRLTLELETAADENFAEEIDALKALNRQKDYLARGRAGRQDPWRASKGGPLREVILTANAEWFDGTTNDFGEVDMIEQARRADDFVDCGIRWLKSRFGDAVITARADFDETAPHIHAIIAPWAEKTSKRRGRQRLLVPNSMPLLASYEQAQDDVGAFFGEIGLTRGQPLAKERREAEAAGEKKPKPPQHTPPHIWRQQEASRLEAEKAALAEKKRQHEEKEVTLSEAIEEHDQRDAALSCRSEAMEKRELDMANAETLLDIAGTGKALPPPVGDEPDRIRRLRKRTTRAFEETKKKALRDADHMIAERIEQAKSLAVAAATFRAALIEAIPEGLRKGILRRVDPAAAELREEEKRVTVVEARRDRKTEDPKY